jgi:hypothetical protein
MSAAKTDEWWTMAKVRATLPFSPKTITKLADEGRIGSLLVPGVGRRLFSREDVERLATSSVRPATVGRELAGV